MKTESFYKEIRYTAACMNMIEKDTKASEKLSNDTFSSDIWFSVVKIMEETNEWRIYYYGHDNTSQNILY